MRPKLTYANLMATIAVFIALGGASYAALKLPKNSVGAKQLKKNSVTTAKIKKEAVTNAKVKRGTLTGTQINTSTLGKVPSAAQADNAANAAHANNADFAGNGARRIDFSSEAVDPAPSTPPITPAAHQLLALGNLTVSASCVKESPSEARTYVSVASSVHAEVNWATVKFENPGDVAFTDGTFIGPDANPSYAISSVKGGDRSEVGQWIYRNATETITLSLSIYANENECLANGTAIRGTS